MVLLHGGYGSWLHWVRNVNALSTRFTVWVPDLPGYHESSDPTPGTSEHESFGLLVSTLAQSWTSLCPGPSPLTLVGFSFGALVATAWAAQDRAVERLVLLGPSGHGTPRRPIAPLNSWKSMAVDAERRAAIVQNLRLHMLHAPEAADPLAEMVHEEACITARYRSREISRSDKLARMLCDLRRPVLFIWGEHDVTAFPAAVATLLCRDHPERDARIVGNAGHWVQYERPDEVNELIIDWVTAALPPTAGSAAAGRLQTGPAIG
jgi:pimeloyl-ACP methyl ester carboxylesterase